MLKKIVTCFFIVSITQSLFACGGGSGGSSNDTANPPPPAANNPEAQWDSFQWDNGNWS